MEEDIITITELTEFEQSEKKYLISRNEEEVHVKSNEEVVGYLAGALSESATTNSTKYNLEFNLLPDTEKKTKEFIIALKRIIRHHNDLVDLIDSLSPKD